VAIAGEITIEVTAGVVAEPVPCNGSIAGRCIESVTNLTLPAVSPTLDAANFTLNVAVCPVARLTGIVKPLILNPVPLRTACVTLTGVMPVFVRVTGSELAVPTFALTVRLLGATASVGSGSVTPAQPDIHSIVRVTKALSTRTSFPCRQRRLFMSFRPPFSQVQFF
jgi:hypothetical protein